MISIASGARLHFGLLNPGPVGPEGRRFGGAGMMIDRPGIRVRIEPAPDWLAEGPLSARVLTFARHFATALAAECGLPLSPQKLVVEEAPPEHAGLGSGTQMGLAVARALAACIGRRHPATRKRVPRSGSEDSAASPARPLAAGLPIEDLARMVGRGLRSGLGLHGFEQGGFLVDAGRRPEGGLAPLVARSPVPEDWRVVLVLPRDRGDWHGGREQRAFDTLTALQPTPAVVDRLCRLVLLGMLPALVERDLQNFGDALHEFNVRAGELFAPVQGGIYASQGVADLVGFLRAHGVRGAGQSSWGPTVFAFTAGQAEAETLAQSVQQRIGAESGQVMIAHPRNHGVAVQPADACG
jgi:beta-ribofuranosylaminobenzene 5'-phosphate synthase